MNTRPVWFEPAPTGLCLRLKLQPFSLGHYFLLAELGSPFVQEGESAEITDLMLAVFLCSQPHSKARRSVNDWWVKLFFNIWAYTLRNLNWNQEAKVFGEYLKGSFATHPVRNPKENGKVIESPHAYRLLTALMETGYSETDALNMDLIKANSIYLTRLEFMEKISFVPGRVIEFYEWAKEQDKKKFNQAD